MAILTSVRWYFIVVSSALALIHICKGQGLRAGMPGMYTVQHWEWCVCVCLVAQSCATLWDSLNCSPPGTSVRGIFQARILEWVAISSSRGSSQPRDRTQVSCMSYIGRCILSTRCAIWEALLRVESSLNFVPLAPHSALLVSVLHVHRNYFLWFLDSFRNMNGGSKSAFSSQSVWLACKFDSLGFGVCHVIYWKSMLDAGFLHFHDFIFQGWYLNFPPTLYFLCGLRHFSHVQLFGTLWTVALQAPLSTGFSRQEHWCGLPFSSPGGLPDPEIEPTSPASPALASRFFTTSTTWEALIFPSFP